jgi:hypothetical protein
VSIEIPSGGRLPSPTELARPKGGDPYQTLGEGLSLGGITVFLARTATLRSVPGQRCIVYFGSHPGHTYPDL